MKNLDLNDVVALFESLLKNSAHPHAKDFLEFITEEQILFKSSDKKSKENSKEAILLSYQLKASWEKNRAIVEQTTVGYKELLSKLSQTEYKHIKISEFTGQKATFFIFSNFEITELIGILKSNQTVKDIEGKLKKL